MKVEIRKLYNLSEQEARMLDEREIPSKLLTDGHPKGENVEFEEDVVSYVEFVLSKDNGDYYGSKLYFRSKQGVWYRVSSYGFIKDFKRVGKESKGGIFRVKVKIGYNGDKVVYTAEEGRG